MFVSETVDGMINIDIVKCWNVYKKVVLHMILM